MLLLCFFLSCFFAYCTWLFGIDPVFLVSRQMVFTFAGLRPFAASCGHIHGVRGVHDELLA